MVENRNSGEMEGRRRPGSRNGIARPEAPGWRHSPGGPRPRRHLSQKLAPGQAGVAQPALRVQDSHLGRPAGRTEPIPRHANLDPLAHHVPAESDPRPPGQLQPECRDLGQDPSQSGRKARWLQDEHLDAGSTGQRRQSPKSLRQARRRYPGSGRGPGLQVQQQQVHRSILEEHRRHRQRLLERTRRQDDEPVELDSPSHGLHRIKAPGQIQIRHDPTRGLSPGDGLERERRLAAGPIAVQRGRRRARQPAQSQDGVQSPEPGWYRPIRRFRRLGGTDRQPFRIGDRTGPRRHRQRPHDLDSSRWKSCAPARSRSTQAFPEGRQSGLDVGWRGAHGFNSRTYVLSVKTRSAR